MYRRRRPKHDIPFSFDSFLDVVANVCGIIIRLILVAWVGARSYHAVAAREIVDASLPSAESAAVASLTGNEKGPGLNETGHIADPLEAAMERHRAELARQQERLRQQLAQYQHLEKDNAETARKLSALATSQTVAQQQRDEWQRAAAEKVAAGQSIRLTLADLQKRSQELAAQMQELEDLPPLAKTLQYRTPVSRPVHTEELHFECRQGRISFIDLQAFLIEIRRGFEDKANQLKTRWEVEAATSPVGAFRLRYVVERERGFLGGTGPPDPQANFRYGLAAWIVEPTLPARGEGAATALTAGSAFRRIIDSLDPEQTVVTLWLYPDSFELYRQVRDFLHERNVEVAGRPLPEGMPIASSRQGTASRGQ